MNVYCDELLGPNDTEEQLYLIFNTPISVDVAPAIIFNGQEIFNTPLESLNVEFKCAYRASVNVNTDEFAVQSWQMDDNVLQTGS